MLGVLVVLVGALVAQSAINACTSDRGRTRQTLASLRWWMVPAGVLIALSAGALYAALSLVPGLSWGWYQLVAGEPGNVMLAQSDRGGSYATFSILIPALLLFAIPREAWFEEKVFRAGNQERTTPRRALRCIGFGMVHCVVGVPVAAGLALISTGIYYESIYQRAINRRREELTHFQTPHSDVTADLTATATHTVAAAHATTNWTIVGTYLLALVLTA